MNSDNGASMSLQSLHCGTLLFKLSGETENSLKWSEKAEIKRVADPRGIVLSSK